VPEPGIILTGCTMNITDPPAGFSGGMAASSTLFNPFGLPGYDTNSVWTFRFFRE
jgi:hypothetical protein